MGKIKDIVKNHLVDSFYSGTGIFLASNPIRMASETIYAGQTISESFESGLKLMGLVYLIVGRTYSGLRKQSQKLFKVHEKGVPEWKKFVHDSIYGFCFTYPLLYGLYYSSGSSPESVSAGALSSSLVAMALDPVYCYSMDTFKDLCGYEESKRKTLKAIKNAPKRTKKYLAVTMVALSLTAITGVYATKHYFFKDTCIKQMLEERSSSSRLESIVGGQNEK